MSIGSLICNHESMKAVLWLDASSLGWEVLVKKVGFEPEVKKRSYGS